MSLVIVLTLLAQSPSRDDDWAKEREEAIAEAFSPAERFVITPPAGWAEGATKRFVGAFVGGLVGMAAPGLAAVALTPPCASFGCGFNFGATLTTGLAPMVSVVGATLGFTLMGGRMCAGAAIGGMIGGLAAGLALLFVHRLIVVDSNQPQWGAVIAAGALAVAIEAIALESRHDALEEAGFIEAPTSRLAFTSLGLVGTLAGIALASAGVALIGYPTGVTLAPIFAVLALAAAPLVPWRIHRNMGGEGTLGAAYVGWIASLAVAGAGALAATVSSSFALSFGTDPRTVAMFGGGISLAVIATALGTPLMLEWSHGNARRERARVAPLKAQLAMSPLTGPQGLAGGVVGLSGTF
ncbi:MAG: hypothetical protein ABTQ32_09985 [Myxococcaceae bacterium]